MEKSAIVLTTVWEGSFVAIRNDMFHLIPFVMSCRKLFELCWGPLGYCLLSYSACNIHSVPLIKAHLSSINLHTLCDCAD